jgi:hypothetical protein
MARNLGNKKSEKQTAETQDAMETIAEGRKKERKKELMPKSRDRREEMSSLKTSFSFCDILLLLSQEVTFFCIVLFFISSLIKDTKKLSLMTHAFYCLRNERLGSKPYLTLKR